MNKSELKNFAINARLELIQRVSDKAARYGITDELSGKNAVVPSVSFQKLGGVLLTKEEIRQRDALLRRVTERGYRQVMEESAYTWFNRLIALRYMQEHNLLPVDVRVLPAFAGETPPLVTEAHNVVLDGADPEKVLDMVGASETEALYKYLLIALCNQLSGPLPQMFERISDDTELLFPDGILREDSVLGMLSQLGGENWREIQVIGWLYQYYISQRHDEVININGGPINKNDIPAATCLYTTDWVVRYMVENSLGRIWLEGHPDKTLQNKWLYYMAEAQQEVGVAAKLAVMREARKTLQPETITVLDPCMGSGHILVYAFDVLMDIYRSVGYTDRDAVRNIVEHNLYGLDIDDRAAQLAYFAVMMKACEYDHRFLRRGVQPHVCAIQESNNLEAFTRLRGQMRLNTLCLNTANALIEAFRDAKEYGSILSPAIDSLSSVDDLMRLLEVASLTDMEIQSWYEDAKSLLPQLAGQALIMQRKYDAVVTNPPYLNKFNNVLKNYVQQNYAAYKADLFSVFMYRGFGYCKEGGYTAFMTPFVWMFIKSYESLRAHIFKRKSITTLIQMEYSAFEEATVPICTFVLCNAPLNYKGNYLRLADFKGGMDVQNDKVLEAQLVPDCLYRYTARQDNFSKIPGAPVAYWVGPAMLRAFANGKPLREISQPCVGLQTGDNTRFLRLWSEVDINHIGLTMRSRREAEDSSLKWFPYNKGGEFRKWYGNNDFIVNWENDGHAIQNTYGYNGRLASRPQNMDYFFRESITWSKVSSGNIAFRYKPSGHIFDVAGTSIFTESAKLEYIHGFCNSKVALLIANVLSPTLNYEVGHIAGFPIIQTNEYGIKQTVTDNVSISKADWDDFETSWDFKRHSLI